MKINFLCQQEQPAFANDSCHVVCLLMLLEFIHLSPLPSYEDLCEVFNLSDCTNLSPEIATAAIVKFIVEQNIKFRIMFRKEDWAEALNSGPIMAAMYGGKRFWGQGGHMIILTHYKEGIFTYLDPWFAASTGRHVKIIDTENFYKYYAGFSCQLFP